MTQTGELGDRELKTSYWLLTHRNQIRKMFMVGLIVLNLALLVPVGLRLYGYIKEQANSKNWINDLRNTSIGWAQVHQQIKPGSLVLTKSAIVPRTKDTYDVALWIKNPNPEWFAAQADVTVVLAGTKSATQSIFVLPNEEKVIVVINMRIPPTTNIAKEIARPNIIVNSWRRLDNPDNYLLPNLVVTETAVESLGDQQTQTRVTGRLLNGSLSGYGRVDLTAILWSGQKAVGVSTGTLQKVTLNEERLFDIRFPQHYLNVTNITVSANTNNLELNNVID